MKTNDIKKLYSALEVLKKEFGKSKCKEKCASCIQCWVDISIIQLEAIINLVDESKWETIKK